MKKNLSVSFFIPLLLLTVVSCASQKQSTVESTARENGTARLIPPDFVVRQVGGPSYAARHVTGPISVNLQIDVINRSAETLKVDHIRLETIGEGAYTIRPETRSIGKSIEPNKMVTLEVWLSGEAQDTILGNSGPVTIRGTAFFDSEYGKFQKVFMQQLNDGMKGQRSTQ